jgi:hypothetical protein
MEKANLRGTTDKKESCHYCFFCFHDFPVKRGDVWVDGWCSKLKIERDMYHTYETCDFWLDEIETEKKLDASYEREYNETHRQTEGTCV